MPTSWYASRSTARSCGGYVVLVPTVVFAGVPLVVNLRERSTT
jgi:hypothetical protein